MSLPSVHFFARTSRLLVGAAALALAGCATTATQFVDSQAAFSVTRGNILRVVGLSSERLERLADGVAMTVTDPGCRVDFEYPDGRQQQLPLPIDTILICAYDSDFILRPEPESSSTQR